MIKQFKDKFPIVSFLCCLMSLNSLLAHQKAYLYPSETTLLWESRYVDSGRQDLAEGGLFSSEYVWDNGPLSWGLWLGVADQEDYQEYNLFADYTLLLGPIELACTYTHLKFQPDDSEDNELSLKAKYEHGGGWFTEIATVYSLKADGYFMECSLAYPLEYKKDKILITPTLLTGIDLGYRTAEHDGLNHIQCMLEVEYIFSKHWTLIAYAAHSLAKEDVRREALGDLSWAGIGLNARF